jgi:hypothetical protein
MTTLQLLITLACGAGAGALAAAGAYWLGARNALRAIVREHLERELAQVLEEGLDDDDGGIHVGVGGRR